jgi:hypothetical protein
MYSFSCSHVLLYPLVVFQLISAIKLKNFREKTTNMTLSYDTFKKIVVVRVQLIQLLRGLVRILNQRIAGPICNGKGSILLHRIRTSKELQSPLKQTYDPFVDRLTPYCECANHCVTA